VLRRTEAAVHTVTAPMVSETIRVRALEDTSEMALTAQVFVHCDTTEFGFSSNYNFHIFNQTSHSNNITVTIALLQFPNECKRSTVQRRSTPV